MSVFGIGVLDALRFLTASLPQEVRWALVGGLAVSARAEPRFTRDVDLAVAVVDDAAAEQVVAQLLRSGWTTSALVEQERVGRLAQVRLTSAQAGPITCDLLFASSGIEPEIVAGAEVLEVIPDLALPVASTGHLIALKLLSIDDRRHQDRADLEALAAVADDMSWRVAAEAAALITQRGFARGRDLQQSLTQLRSAS